MTANPRWKTFEPGCTDEEALRSKTHEAIERWWNAFSREKDDIIALFKGEAQWDLARWMQENLQGIHPHLMWEFGPGDGTGHRLVITPENRFDLRPLVDEILARAPSLQGWSFFGHRLPESWEMTLATVEGRTGSALQASGIRCTKGRFNRVDVVVEYPKQFLAGNEELAFSQAFVLIESLLGEQALNAWVGEITTAKKTWRSRKTRDLPGEFNRLRNSILDALPEVPVCSLPGELEWTLFQLKPPEADDYPGQSDMMVGKAIDTEQWMNFYGGVSYFSERYSKCGETFCYLKIDGIEGMDGTPWEDKGDIEDALEDTLKPEGLGCLISGGTGYRYSYIGLALTDLSRALAEIRRVLKAGDLTRRAWILFFDSEWKSEWFGIWPDSPAPPADPVED